MATLKELKEKRERINKEREDIDKDMAERARKRVPRGPSSSGWVGGGAGGSEYPGRYGAFIRDMVEAQNYGEEAMQEVLRRHVNKLTRIGVTRERAIELLVNALKRYAGSGGEYYEELDD